MHRIAERHFPTSLHMRWQLNRLGRVVFCCLVLSSTVIWAADQPATVDEAAKVLDLRHFDLLNGAETSANRTVANLTYETKSTVDKAHRFHAEAMTKAGWKVLPDGYASEQMASSTYAKDGYKVSLSVMPTGDAGVVMVTLNNHGNVDTSKLPAPDDSKPFYSTPVSTAYLTSTSVDATARLLRDKFTKAGWEPYGDAGDVANYKQNAIQLHVRVTTAPAQNNQTLVDYSTELMSADLPAPPDAPRVQYADVTRQLSFDAKGSVDEVAAYYRKRLGEAGWKATTDNLIEVDFEKMLLFRNAAKDMLTLKLRAVDALTRGQLEFLTAEDVDKMQRELDKKHAESEPTAEQPPMAEEKPAAPDAKAIIVEVPLADTTKVKQTSEESLEFAIASGAGQSAAESLRKHFLAAGWNELNATLEKVAGNVMLTKDGTTLSIVYSDIGIGDSEVTVMAIGGKVAVKKVETKKTEAKKADPKKVDPQKADPKKSDPKKSDRKKK